MNSIYPKLPGLPTKPGLYEIRRGKERHFAGVWIDDTGMPCAACTDGWAGRVRSLDRWTWYGPIPEPTTGEREPCGAWELIPSCCEGPDEWRLRSATGELLAEIVGGDGVAYLNAGESFATVRDAKLAAEDAILQECGARTAVIMGGTDHAR